MSITVAKLHRLLGALIEGGHARKPVCISKETFRHRLEPDGVTVLGVEYVEGPTFIPTSDDDGGVKTRSDGTEAGRLVVILKGACDE